MFGNVVVSIWQKVIENRDSTTLPRNGAKVYVGIQLPCRAV